MNKPVHFTTIILLTLFWISGCSHFPEAINDSIGSEESTAGFYLEKADALIQRDELQRAWNYLEIARQLAPQDERIPVKISILKDEIFKKADHHFKKGVIAYNQQNLSEAKKEFLTVLRYFPEHKAALNYLRSRIHPAANFEYHIQKGDTSRTIAKKVYQNEDLAFLVEYFIRKENQEKDTEPSFVSLPILRKKWIQKEAPRKTAANAALKPEPGGEKKNQKQILAEQLFQKGKYKQVIALTEDLIKNNPDNQELMKLYNYSCYYEGKALIKNNQLIPAMEILNRITMDLTDIDQLRTKLRAEMKNQSEIHYRRGVTFFINEDLKQSISEWEKTLALAPENQKARKAIENAKNLLQKLEGVK